MKTPAWFKSKDVTKSYILPVVLLILSGVVMFTQKASSLADEWEVDETPDEGYRTASIKTKCYSIPYTREQLKKIERDGGEAREELNRILLDKTKAEDLAQIIAPPKIVFDENSAMVCLDFNDPTEPAPTRFKTRLA